MTDRLYLSYWIPNFHGLKMARIFERVLRAFPHSVLSQSAITLRIQPLTFGEPPVFERDYQAPYDLEAVMSDIREYWAMDSVLTLETGWDIWKLDADWHLSPNRVVIVAVGPEFEEEQEEQVRVELGSDDWFLARKGDPAAYKPIEQNVQSLLKLDQDLTQALQPDKRKLWSESGDNFAEKLRQSLQ